MKNQFNEEIKNKSSWSRVILLFYFFDLCFIIYIYVLSPVYALDVL